MTTTDEILKEDKESVCDECGSKSIIHDTIRGEKVCEDCGLVQKEKIYTNTVMFRKRTRGETEFIKQNEVVCFPIELSCRTTFNPNKASKNKGQYFRMKQQNERAEKQIGLKHLAYSTAPEVTLLTQKYGLSMEIYNQVIKLLIKIQKAGLFKGRNAKDFVYASLHIICRKCNPIHSISVYDEKKKDIVQIHSPLLSLKTIAKLEKIPVKYINKAFFQVCDTLNLVNKRRVPQINLFERLKMVISALENQFLVDIEFRDKIRKYIPLMEEIYNQAKQIEGTIYKDKDPVWVIIGVIYLFQDRMNDGARHISQEKLGLIGGVSEITLRSYIRKIKKILALIGKD